MVWSVFTVNGPRPIGDLAVGDAVWSREEDGSASVAAVTSISKRSTKVLKITSRQRTILCPVDQLVLAREKRVATKQTRLPGGRCLNNRYNILTTEPVDASSLAVGRLLIAVNRASARSDDAPTRKVSIPFMEVLGLFLGDGSMMRQNGRVSGVSFARHEAAPYMAPYREAILGEFRRTSRRKGMLLLDEPVHVHENSVASIVTSVEMANEFVDLGLDGNSYTKRVPSWVFSLGDDLKLALLRGYLDSDGTVTKDGRIRFLACQRPLIDDMWHLCVSLGIPVTNIRFYITRAETPQGRIYDQRSWQFSCCNPADNLRIGSHTPEYVRRMESAPPFKDTEGKFPKRGGRGFDDRDFIMTRIASIADEGEVEVIDLEVGGTGSFVLNGVVVQGRHRDEIAAAA